MIYNDIKWDLSSGTLQGFDLGPDLSAGTPAKDEGLVTERDAATHGRAPSHQATQHGRVADTVEGGEHVQYFSNCSKNDMNFF